MIPRDTIVSRARTRFESESSVRWSDAGIVSAINEGLDELSEQTHFYRRYVSIPLVADRIFYDIRGYVPDDAIGLTAAWSTIRNDWLKPRSEDELDPRWEEATGDPYEWFVRGAFHFGVHPHPTSSTSGYLRVWFSGLAPHFTHGQSVIADLPDDFIPALEDYVLYELQARDGETKKSLLHWKDFSRRARMLEEFVRKRGARAFVGHMGGRR